MALARILTALLAASTPGTEPDLSFADPEAPGLDLSAPTLEARTGREVPDVRDLTLEAGDTVFVVREERLPPRRPTPVVARVVSARSDRGVSTAATAELLGVRKRHARIRYAIRAGSSPDDAPRSVRFLLELRGEDGAAVHRARVEHSVRVIPATPTPEDITVDAAAYRHHQALARTAFDALPELKDYLRLDRVDRPPSLSRVPVNKREHLQSFLRNRLRADVARARLRADADSSDPELARAAARAIGGLSDKPTGPAARARAIEGLSTDKALDLAARALQDLEIDEAEGFLNKLRTSGRLERAQLARALALLGQVYWVRGRAAAAQKALGGAVCLDAKVAPGPERPALVTPLEAARAAAPCPAGLQVRGVTATRLVDEGSPAVEVDVALAPDPHRVISGGAIEVWGFGGGVDKTRTVPVRMVDGAPHLVARFPDDESSLTTDRVLLKVLAKDVSGVLVASYGDPDPSSVAIANAEVGAPGAGVPSWVWWLAGGVAVAGGVAAGVWAVGNREDVQRGIGPVDVRF